MPFAVTNQKTINVGGGLRLTRGQWTGSAGDAPGTLGMQGGIVWSGKVWSNVSAGGVGDVDFSFTASGNVITATVNNISAVTDGYFLFLHS